VKKEMKKEESVRNFFKIIFHLIFEKIEKLL